jgi:preprotein translocase subunit SecG
MVIVILFAALILIGLVLLVIRKSGPTSPVASPGRDRFRNAGPGDAKPKEPRATGLN